MTDYSYFITTKWQQWTNHIFCSTGPSNFTVKYSGNCCKNNKEDKKIHEEDRVIWLCSDSGFPTPENLHGQEVAIQYIRCFQLPLLCLRMYYSGHSLKKDILQVQPLSANCQHIQTDKTTSISKWTRNLHKYVHAIAISKVKGIKVHTVATKRGGRV